MDHQKDLELINKVILEIHEVMFKNVNPTDHKKHLFFAKNILTNLIAQYLFSLKGDIISNLATFSMDVQNTLNINLKNEETSLH